MSPVPAPGQNRFVFVVPGKNHVLWPSPIARTRSRFRPPCWPFWLADPPPHATLKQQCSSRGRTPSAFRTRAHRLDVPAQRATLQAASGAPSCDCVGRSRRAVVTFAHHFHACMGASELGLTGRAGAFAKAGVVVALSLRGRSGAASDRSRNGPSTVDPGSSSGRLGVDPGWIRGPCGADPAQLHSRFRERRSQFADAFRSAWRLPTGAKRISDRRPALTPSAPKTLLEGRAGSTLRVCPGPHGEPDRAKRRNMEAFLTNGIDRLQQTVKQALVEMSLRTGEGSCDSPKKMPPRIPHAGIDSKVARGSERRGSSRRSGSSGSSSSSSRNSIVETQNHTRGLVLVVVSLMVLVDIFVAI